MSLNRIAGNLYVAGQLTADSINLPDSIVGNQQISAADPIESDKQRHLFAKVYSQEDATSVFDVITCVHVALVAGEVAQFQAGFRVPSVGDSVVTVDLKKNGVSILSDIIDIDSSIASYTQVVAGINPVMKAYNVGDVFEMVVVCTDGTGTPGEGLFAQVAFDEGAF